jgi:hypothetical protein
MPTGPPQPDPRYMQTDPRYMPDRRYMPDPRFIPDPRWTPKYRDLGINPRSGVQDDAALRERMEQVDDHDARMRDASGPATSSSHDIDDPEAEVERHEALVKRLMKARDREIASARAQGKSDADIDAIVQEWIPRFGTPPKGFYKKRREPFWWLDEADRQDLKRRLGPTSLFFW